MYRGPPQKVFLPGREKEGPPACPRARPEGSCSWHSLEKSHAALGSGSQRVGMVIRTPLEELLCVCGLVTRVGSLYDGVRSIPPGATCALGGSGMTGGTNGFRSNGLSCADWARTSPGAAAASRTQAQSRAGLDRPTATPPRAKIGAATITDRGSWRDVETTRHARPAGHYSTRRA